MRLARVKTGFTQFNQLLCFKITKCSLIIYLVKPKVKVLQNLYMFQFFEVQYFNFFKAIIHQIFHNKFTYRAGLRVHDIIIAIDGIEIESASEVAKVVKSKDTFDVVVIADGEEFELNVEIVENNFM